MRRQHQASAVASAPVPFWHDSFWPDFYLGAAPHAGAGFGRAVRELLAARR